VVSKLARGLHHFYTSYTKEAYIIELLGGVRVVHDAREEQLAAADADGDVEVREARLLVVLLQVDDGVAGRVGGQQLGLAALGAQGRLGAVNEKKGVTRDCRTITMPTK
jgi:hypothetical protein